MKKLRPFTLITIILIALHLLAPVAAAHPLGNFTINHYAGLHVSREVITIDYVLDMAEIPTFQEISAFDSNRNGQADADETARYHPAQCEAIQADLELRLNHQPLALSLESSALEFPPGAGGLPTLRLTCAFQAAIAVTENVQVEFKNKTYAERLGWREIVVTSEGVSLEGDLAAMSQSVSQRLTVYPNDLLSSPLNQREVSFNLMPMDALDQLSAQSTSAQSNQPFEQQPNLPPVDRNDGFTRLISAENLSPLTLLIALAISFGWGAAHALTPGHGKTIVAAYLVGSRGTTRHAFFLGLTTTVTHTAGVFILGFLTLFASRFILPEQLYPWLGVASGLLVVSIGFSLFKGRLRQLVGLSDPGHHHEQDQPHDQNHFHDHSHDGYGHTHNHLPPGTAGSPVTWRNLLALGIFGGLIPCPSALVVMLSAIALQRIGFGLLLIVAFSLGLASVLTAIGVLWVHAGRLFGRIPARRNLIQILPAMSALFITVIGLGIMLQALMQTGVLPAAMTTTITMVVARVGIPF